MRKNLLRQAGQEDLSANVPLRPTLTQMAGGLVVAASSRIRLLVGAAVYFVVLTTIVSVNALPAAAATLKVTNCNDSGPGSLRQAVASAHSGARIKVAPRTCSTITLASTINIATSVALAGSRFHPVAITGDITSRLFTIPANVSVTVSRLTISTQKSLSDGGGISNAGMLTVTNSTLSGDLARLGGGAILNAGTLMVTNSTLSNDEGYGGGGGAISNSGTATIVDSTLSENLSRQGLPCGCQTGGAIASDGTLTIINSTLSGNAVDGHGGAIAGSGSISVSNSTIAGNTAYPYIFFTSNTGGIYGQANVTATVLANNSGGDCSSVLTDGGFNIDDDGSCGFSSPSVSDSPTLDKTLGPLENNGGPTQTIALLPGNPAIDYVTPSADCPRTDQRGVARKAPCDIGAFDTDRRKHHRQ